MKKKTLQRAAALTLSGVMVMGALTGCGGKKDDSSTSAPADNNTAATDTNTSTDNAGTDTAAPADTTAPAENTAAGMDGWTPFENQVTLQIPVYDRGDSGNGCSDVVNN